MNLKYSGKLNYLFKYTAINSRNIISVLLMFLLMASTLIFASACSPVAENISETESKSVISETAKESTPEAESTPEPTAEPTPDPNAKYIALTFDDGPSPARIERLLSILEEENVIATFFVLGQSALTYPDIVEKAFKNGHEIANHTYDHTVLTGSNVTMEKIAYQMDRTSEIIEEITGKVPVSFRPPQGSYNSNVMQAAQERGMAIYHWSWESCPEDWKNSDPEVIANIVVEGARNGHLVLLHDTNNNTIDAVPDIIKGLREKGFIFVTVTELIEKGPDKNPIPGKVYFYNFS